MLMTARDKLEYRVKSPHSMNHTLTSGDWLLDQAQSAKPSACHKNTIQSNTYHMHAGV